MHFKLIIIIQIIILYVGLVPNYSYELFNTIQDSKKNYY